MSSALLYPVASFFRNVGDWGLGAGDSGLGENERKLSSIPNPQPPNGSRGAGDPNLVMSCWHAFSALDALTRGPRACYMSALIKSSLKEEAYYGQGS